MTIKYITANVEDDCFGCWDNLLTTGKDYKVVEVVKEETWEGYLVCCDDGKQRVVGKCWTEMY